MDAFLVLVVGQACSLKCKNCANFAPYAPKEMLHYSFADIQRSLTVIWNALGGIQKVQIQGGEPFCVIIWRNCCIFCNSLIAWVRLRLRQMQRSYRKKGDPCIEEIGCIGDFK